MKKLKKLEIVKKAVVELGNKQLNELKGGYEECSGWGTGCSPGPNGTQVNTCATDSCCK